MINKDLNPIEFFCGIGIGLILGLIIGFNIANIKRQIDITELKLEAINKGYAEWVVNNENGTTTFKFKQNNIELPTNK